MWAYIISISLFSYVDGRNWCFLKKLFYKIWLLSFVRIEDKLKPTKNLSFFNSVWFSVESCCSTRRCYKELKPIKSLTNSSLKPDYELSKQVLYLEDFF